MTATEYSSFLGDTFHRGLQGKKILKKILKCLGPNVCDLPWRTTGQMETDRMFF